MLPALARPATVPTTGIALPALLNAPEALLATLPTLEAVLTALPALFSELPALIELDNAPVFNAGACVGKLKLVAGAVGAWNVGAFKLLNVLVAPTLEAKSTLGIGFL